MKLLYREQKKDDEFLGDYISRIASKNGFENKDKFRKILKEYYLNNCEKIYGNIDNNALRRMALERIFQRNIPVDASHLYNNSRRDLWAKEWIFCRECWNQEPYIRFYWWLSDYKICHVHNKKMSAKILLNSLTSEPSIEPTPNLIGMIVQKYSKMENPQNLIINEIERTYYDISILEGVADNFGKEAPNFTDNSELRSEILSGEFIGLPVDLRILRCANYYKNIAANQDFWLRIISLMVCNYKRKGLFCSSRWSNREHARYCMFILGSDPTLKKILSKISDLREYKDMKDICINDIKKCMPTISDALSEKIKISLFASRHIFLPKPIDKFKLQLDIERDIRHRKRYI
jgi:hypothetical protein